MCRETRGHDVDRPRGDRQRRRVGLDEHGIRYPGARQDAGAGLEHLARRVHTDRAPEVRRDAAERVTDAGPDIHDAFTPVLRR